jgi:threonine dehydrogenase-like Zn-dependent dehydrogenase
VLTGPRQIELQEFPLPPVGEDDGVLRVEACGICGADYPVFSGLDSGGGPLSISPPVILGHEIVGRIERVGERAASRWGVGQGDRIVVERWIPCGHCERCYRGEYRLCIRSVDGGKPLFYGGAPTTLSPALWGGYADYLYLHPDSVIYKAAPEVPAHLLPLFTPLANGLCWVQEYGQLRPGGTIVIQGPGQEGLAAVLAAREAGAHHIIVTGLRRDAARLAMARELGATTTLVAGDDDVIAGVRQVTGGALADVVLDVTDGNSVEPLELAVEAAREGGTIVLAAGHRGQASLSDRFAGQIFAKTLTVRGVRGRHRWAIFAALRLIESQKYPLERLCTKTVGLDDVSTALALVGREGGEDVFHIAVEPSGGRSERKRFTEARKPTW